MPTWLKTAACVVLALPFGWVVGVLIAVMIAGPDLGQLPAVTVGLSILGATIFAVWPSFQVDTRLRVMFFGSIVVIMILRMMP